MTDNPWSIAGVDPSSGAGLYQDLRVFDALGLRGMGVPTALTVQNLTTVKRFEPVSAGLFGAMLEALMEEDLPGALKIGLLPETLVGPLRCFLEDLPKEIPSVFDPVFRFGTGHPFWRPASFREMARLLFPRLTMITPNLPEAQELSGWSVENFPGDLLLMARRIHEQFGVRSILIKGGHYEGPGPKVDLFWTPDEEKFFFHPARTIRGVHGGGCTLSSLIAGLAIRDSFPSLAAVVEEALGLYQIMLEKATGEGRLVLDPSTIRRVGGS